MRTLRLPLRVQVREARLQLQAEPVQNGEVDLFAGMLAAVVISVRVFLFKGAGKAN